MFSISQCNSYVYLPIFPMNPYISTVHILSSYSGQFCTLFLQTYTDTFLFNIVGLLFPFSSYIYLLNLLLSFITTSAFHPPPPRSTNFITSNIFIHWCKSVIAFHSSIFDWIEMLEVMKVLDGGWKALVVMKNKNMNTTFC